MKEKVVVLFGGESVEHDISIITALQVLRNVPQNYDVLPVYIDKSGVWWVADNLCDVKIYKKFEKLAKNRKRVTILLGENILLVQKSGKYKFYAKIYSVLNCCHGRIGEDGCVSGIFKASNTAISSCDVVSSAVCMDKTVMKDILKANEILSPEYVYFDIDSYEKVSILKQIRKKLGFPVVVKPANLGSSIGISVCKSEDEFENAVKLAFEFDKKILVEKFVNNLREFNCACVHFRNQTFTSSVNEVFLEDKIFTFDEKYLLKKQKTAHGCRFLTKKIKKLTEKIYNLFGCCGVVRVDFLFDSVEKKLYINEVNTIPGSLAFYLFKEISFKDFVSCLIEQSRTNFEENKKFVTNFPSDALNVFEAIGEISKK